MSYEVPQSPMTLDDQWLPSGRSEVGSGNSRWVVSRRTGLEALLKPGDDRKNRWGAAQEYIASIIGGWLGLRVKRVELAFCWGLPVALCYQVGTICDGNRAVRHSDDAIRVLAARELPTIAGVLVLDALINAGSRHPRHLVFAKDAGQWISLDYSDCFGTPPFHDQSTGPPLIGNPRAAFGDAYFREFRDVALRREAAIEATCDVAEGIPDGSIEALVGSIPPEFVSANIRAAAISYLKFRRTNIRALIW